MLSASTLPFILLSLMTLDQDQDHAADIHDHRMYPPHRALPTAITTPLCTTWIHRNHVARTTLTSSQRIRRSHHPRHHILRYPINQSIRFTHSHCQLLTLLTLEPRLLPLTFHISCCSVARILHELCTATAPRLATHFS